MHSLTHGLVHTLVTAAEEGELCASPLSLGRHGAGWSRPGSERQARPRKWHDAGFHVCFVIREPGLGAAFRCALPVTLTAVAAPHPQARPPPAMRPRPWRQAWRRHWPRRRLLPAQRGSRRPVPRSGGGCWLGRYRYARFPLRWEGRRCPLFSFWRHLPCLDCLPALQPRDEGRLAGWRPVSRRAALWPPAIGSTRCPKSCSVGPAPPRALNLRNSPWPS